MVMLKHDLFSNGKFLNNKVRCDKNVHLIFKPKPKRMNIVTLSGHTPSSLEFNINITTQNTFLQIMKRPP